MRDPERQHRMGSAFTVTYPDFPGFTFPPRSVRILQEIGKHDVVELYYPRFSPFLVKAIKTGAPIQITWHNDKVSGNFVGYAVDVHYPTVQTIERGIKVTCVGPSYPLKERASKIWTNKTASEIATEIAQKFKLKPIVTPSSVRFTQQSLAGHSYWEKLNELADRIGYGIQVVGTELHFHPIDKMINQFMTTIPVMAFKEPFTNPMTAYVAGTLDMFEPKIGDFVESNDYERTNKTTAGVDPITGNNYKVQSSPNKVGKNIRKNTKDPLFGQVETRVVVASNAMAKSMADAKAQLSRLAIPAEGAGQGDPRISPWNTIEIRGTGNDSDGFWIIKSVEHYIHRDGRYQVEFKCATDGVGSNRPSAVRPSNAGQVPVRNIAYEMTTANKRKPTTPKLTAKATMLTQGSAGYKVTPRRWEGR